MNLKSIFSLLIITLSAYSFAFEKKEIELADYWQVISMEKDSTLPVDQAKIIFFIEDKHQPTPIMDASIHININTFIGKTDSLGKLQHTFKAGSNRFCADTKEGNSFSNTQQFLAQHIYVVKVIMSTYPQIKINDDYDLYPVAEKPVIYLYPVQKQKINVKVITREDFTFTYPKYKTNGWSVVAQPNGKIETDNRTYNYLFWEAPMPNKASFNMRDGFIVSSDTVVQFLENLLTTVGLNDMEQADFITYWAPRLQQNRDNIIHFEFNEGYDKKISKMEITPKPESLIRIFMTFTKYNYEKNIVKPQEIPTYNRTGFTVVEWGGSEF